MVEGKNTTRARISLQTYENIAQWTLDQLKSSKFQLSLVFCGDRRIKNLNDKYRGKNKVTDVLSFLYDKESGEVIICLSQAKRQARQHDVSIKTELIDLLIHGILHLHGYDHQTPSDASKMLKLQDRLVQQAHDLN